MEEYDKILDDIKHCDDIIKKHFENKSHNVIMVNQKQKENYFTDFIIKEYLDFENILVKKKRMFYDNEDEYFFIIKPNIKQKIVCYLYEKCSFILLCCLFAIFGVISNATNITGNSVINIHIGNFEVMMFIIISFIALKVGKLKEINFYDLLIRLYRK